MSDEKVTNYSRGIGIPTVLTIVFIVLKLCKVISWSWVWVLSPLWITALLVIAIVIIALIVAFIVTVSRK